MYVNKFQNKRYYLLKLNLNILKNILFALRVFFSFVHDLLVVYSIVRSCLRQFLRKINYEVSAHIDKKFHNII